METVTPETMLMLAHSRAYVDQLRTRVDEAGSSVECLTAVDGSEDGSGHGGEQFYFCSYGILHPIGQIGIYVTYDRSRSI